MKKLFKRFAVILLIYAGSIVIVDLLGQMVIINICNVIFGAEESGYLGLKIGSVIVAALSFIVPMLFIYPMRLKDRDDYLKFRDKRQGRDFSAKEDFRELLRDLDVWMDIGFVAVITVIYAVRMIIVQNIVSPIIFLNIPVFIVFEFLCMLRIRFRWCNMD